MLRLALMALAVLLFPTEAFAWGPLAHLAHGSQALADLTIAGLGLQETLRAHRLEYLYGCIGADITQAKKYTREIQHHCHSWVVGWQLVERARGGAQQAFAWGYLSHLASDVYSHNHYVPTQLVVSYEARTLRHTYWEARFDALQECRHRLLLRELTDRRFPECDELVREVVARTLFSFSTNKRIFDSLMGWQRREQWQALVRRVAARSRFPLPDDVVSTYNGACTAAIRDLFRRGRRSSVQREDPTGSEAIARARDLRRKLERLHRRRLLTPELADDVRSLSLERTAALLLQAR